MKVQDATFSSVMVSHINNACMRRATVSRYRDAWIIRGSLSGIEIMYLHRLRAVHCHRLLLVFPCRRLIAPCHRRHQEVFLLRQLIKEQTCVLFMDTSSFPSFHLIMSQKLRLQLVRS